MVEMAKQESGKLWIDNPEELDPESPPNVIIQITVADKRTKDVFVVRRCIGEVTQEIVAGGALRDNSPAADRIKDEMKRMGDELENFILIGIR